MNFHWPIFTHPEPVADPALINKLCEDAASRKRRYRIVPDRRVTPCTFVLYYCGRRVMDTQELTEGAPSAIVEHIEPVDDPLA